MGVLYLVDEFVAYVVGFRMRFLLGLIIGMIIGIIFMERQVCIDDGLVYDWEYGTCKKEQL